MSQFSNLMKQAQQMQAKLDAVQKEIYALEVTGTSGGGMVSVTISGKHNLLKVSIDKSLMNPGEEEIVADLIVAAHSEAKAKLEEIVQEKNPFTDMLPAGIKLPF